MSIGTEIGEAIKNMIARNWELALRSGVIAFAATAPKTYPRGKKPDDKVVFEKFFYENTDIIYPFMLWEGFVNNPQPQVTWNVICQHPGFKKPTPEDFHSIQEILYQVRCDLLHNAEISPTVQLVNAPIIVSGNPTQLPISVVNDLIMAVVGAGVNRHETIRRSVDGQIRR